MNSLTKNQNQVSPVKSFNLAITSEAMKRRINEMIGSERGQSFITNLISSVNSNPALAECELSSLVSAAMVCESLKLSPSNQLGHFYIMPFKDNKLGRVVGTPVIGYKGYIQLAIRSGYYKKLNVIAIKEGELIKYDALNEEIEVKMIEDDSQRENTNTIGYYAMFEYTNGFKKSMYWSKKKMIEHAKKYSSGYRNDLAKGWNMTFWSKDFDGMAYKTMLRQLISKWGIMSVEMQQAYVADTAILRENGIYEYVDNEPNNAIVEEVKVDENGEVKEEVKKETKKKQNKKEEVKEEPSNQNSNDLDVDFENFFGEEIK